jgi:hypothetical protein
MKVAFCEDFERAVRCSHCGEISNARFILKKEKAQITTFLYFLLNLYCLACIILVVLFLSEGWLIIIFSFFGVFVIFTVDIVIVRIYWILIYRYRNVDEFTIRRFKINVKCIKCGFVSRVTISVNIRGEDYRKFNVIDLIQQSV